MLNHRSSVQRQRVSVTVYETAETGNRWEINV